MSFSECHKSIYSPTGWILYFCEVYRSKNFTSMQLSPCTVVTAPHNQIPTFLNSTVSRQFVLAYKTFFKQFLALLQCISHGRLFPREQESPRRRGRNYARWKPGSEISLMHFIKVLPSLVPFLCPPLPCLSP